MYWSIGGKIILDLTFKCNISNILSILQRTITEVEDFHNFVNLKLIDISYKSGNYVALCFLYFNLAVQMISYGTSSPI